MTYRSEVCVQPSDVCLHHMFLCIQKTGSPRLSVYGVCSRVCSTGTHEDGGRAGAGGGTGIGEEQDGGGSAGGGGGEWPVEEELERQEGRDDVRGTVFVGACGRGRGGGGGR